MASMKGQVEAEILAYSPGSCNESPEVIVSDVFISVQKATKAMQALSSSTLLHVSELYSAGMAFSTVSGAGNTPPKVQSRVGISSTNASGCIQSRSACIA